MDLRGGARRMNKQVAGEMFAGMMRDVPTDLTYLQSSQFASGGQVKPEVGSFDGRQFYGRGAHVSGLKLWLRKWDGNPIIGGMQVFYSNGQSPVHGCSKTKEAIEFRLDRDEKITRVDVRAGWLLDSLGFATDKGEMFGPYGGKGGNLAQDTPPGGRSGYLAGISGTIVQTQGAQAITKISFTWACPPEPKYQESSVYAVTSPSHKVDSTFDARNYATGGARINGVKLWIRRAEKPVLAGMQLSFSNGNSGTFGGTNPKEIHEFNLQPDEKINQLRLYLGAVLEGIMFVTNQGRTFGPYGGTVGACVTETPASGDAALAWVSGTVVHAHKGRCFTSVKFGWTC